MYAVISQMIMTMAPLITTPFVTRELGAANLGVFSFTLTNVQYFMLFSCLGIVNYGARAIAEDGSDSVKISGHFWEIFAMQLINSLFILLIYIVYIFILPPDDRIMAMIQSLWLIATIFDIKWFFYGIEEVKITAKKDVLVRLATVAAILLFVRKGHSPLIVYTLIMSIGNLAGILALLPSASKYLTWVKPSLANIVRHYRPNVILFIPLLATSIFHNMDKTMLGWLTSYEELGYYYSADMIINVPLQITIALGTVFLPKATILLAQDDREPAFHFLSTSFEATILLACALAFGIAGCARDFIPVFLGSGYEPCVGLVYLFVPVLIIKSVSSFFRMEYLVPVHREKTYIIATFAGAGANLIFNALLIPRFGASGAVIGTLMAEFTVMVVQLIGREPGMPLINWLRITGVYLIAAILMFAGMFLVSQIPMRVLIRALLEIAAGSCIYLILCFVYWKYIIHNEEILNILTGMLKSKKS